MSEEKNIETIKEVRAKEESGLLEMPGVVGVGTGYKEKDGQETGQLCMCIYVEKKKPKEELAEDEVITARFSHQGIDEVHTDIIETGKLVAQSFTDRYRPAPSGVSIGHFNISAGTFGAVATDNATGRQVILSNNHVLADSNNAIDGDAILQQGNYDGGTLDNDTIAKLLRWQTIDFSGGLNLIDAAIAEPINDADILLTCIDNRIVPQEQQAIGLLFAGSNRVTIFNPIDAVLSELNISLPKTGIATLRMEVHKCGRTTEYTTGKIRDLDATVTVNYGDAGVATFTNQILTGDMSDGGDSGSVLYAKPQDQDKGPDKDKPGSGKGKK